MQEQDKNSKPAPDAQPPAAQGIVSVNSRGGTSDNLLGKVIFVVAVVAVVVIGALMGFNKWRAASKAEQAAAEQTAKGENKPAAVGPRRTFDTDPPPLPTGAQPKADGSGQAADVGSQACADGMPGIVMLGQDGKPMMSPGGVPMRVCRDGRVIVPAVQPQPGAQPVPLAGGQQGPVQGGKPPPSRYAGEVIVAAPNALTGNTQPTQPGPTGNPNDPASTMAMVQSILGQAQRGQGAQSTSLFGGQPPQGQAPTGVPGAPGGQQQAGANPPGSLGSLLTPSQTPMVQAGMLGDRNMILPKGRTIDCGLSMRLVNEVAGMASCVLSQNVYSDNGRVLLLERGSEATGEYVAAMAQGQRRLFVLWTRIKTPAGVVINLNSPAADGLGTSGMDGYIDNHWWERLGAAFLLSMVQDAIAYKTADAGNGTTGGTVVYQNTAQTGNRMAEKVLDSTINIKPTLYKNQGDRGSIYVARDLDFGSVYALRAR